MGIDGFHGSEGETAGTFEPGIPTNPDPDGQAAGPASRRPAKGGRKSKKASGTRSSSPQGLTCRICQALGVVVIGTEAFCGSCFSLHSDPGPDLTLVDLLDLLRSRIRDADSILHSILVESRASEKLTSRNAGADAAPG